MAAALTLLLPLYCYTYSTLLLSTYYYYLLLLATNCWLLLLFLPNLPGLAQDLLSCIFPSAAALCLLSSSCFFLPNLPSPLLSFVLPMMKLSKSIHYMEYELIIKNLWETWHHCQSPLHYLLSSLLWCLDAPSSRSDDDWHVSEASTTCFFIYCCFIGLICFIDLFDFLYLLVYLKHTFLHLLEQSAK